jgi:3-oxoacyl-[acyl-carrier-protein] synthase II
MSRMFPAKEARHMDTFIHYGVAASLQAVADAGCRTATPGRRGAQRIGCLVGSGIGGLPMIEPTTRNTTSAARAASRRS